MTDAADNVSSKHFDVLIVGAGLSGLMMAAQLLRHGVYPKIIDQKLGPDKGESPVVLHARTMELLDQLGLAEAVMQLGQRQHRWSLPGTDLSVELDELPDPDTYYAERWILPGRELERLLVDYLTLKACKIHWGMQLTGMTETDAVVSVEMVDTENNSRTKPGVAGTLATHTAGWVIGADGEHSRVRRALGFSFDGMLVRVASRFAGRRSFLIGDAASCESEDAMQGANTGFQDAWNLGWKLACVVTGRLDRRILRSYQEERHPFATGGRRDKVNRRLRLLLHLHQWVPGLVRNIMSLWLRWLRTRPARQTQLFKQLSGLSIDYRHAPIAVHHSASEQVKAGDRFPWRALFDEKTKSPTDTREIFRKTGFVVVVMGNAGSHMIHVMGQWIRQKYPQGVGLYYIPYSARNQPIFERFDLSPEAVQVILVRPDTYIAYMNNSVNTFLIDHYLEEVIGWI